MRLPIFGISTWWEHAIRLALPVRHLSFVIKDDMTPATIKVSLMTLILLVGLRGKVRLTGRLGPNNALAGNYLCSVRGFVLPGINRNRGLIPIGRGFEEVLLLAGR